MIKLKILYLYLIWIEGFPPKRKVVARLLSGMSFFWVLTGFLMDFGVWMIKEICDKWGMGNVFVPS